MARTAVIQRVEWLGNDEVGLTTEDPQPVMVASNVLIGSDWHIAGLSSTASGVEVAQASESVRLVSGSEAIPGALLSLLIALLAVVAVGRRVS